MPGFIKTPADEKRWTQAKKAAGKQAKAGTAKYWRLANYIWHRMSKATEEMAGDEGKGGYLVTESDGTKHLPTTRNGKPDHGLMGGAWAALHGGYRGNEYEGPNKQAAISKLKALYKREGLKTPAEKEAASLLTRLGQLLGVKPSAPLPLIPESMAEEFRRSKAAQTSPQTATCAVALTFAYSVNGSGTPEWVEVLPGGKFAAIDGRGPFENKDPERIIAASMARMPEVGLVLDYDHSTDLAAPEGRESRAAGWIKGFRVGEKGAIFARVEWTKRAAELLNDKEYRYISPVFEHDDKNEVECILRAALTNNPALIGLPAVASARSAMAKKTKEEMGLRDLMERFPQREDEEDMSYHARMGRHLQAEQAGALTNWAEEEEKEHGMGGAEDMAGHPYEDETEEQQEEEGASAGMNMDKHDADGGDRTPVDPYKDETEEQMAARHKEEMAKCKDEEEASACRMRHQEEASRMARRKEEAARRNKGLEMEGAPGNSIPRDGTEEARSRMSARTRPGMVMMNVDKLKALIKREVDRGITTHPQMLSAQKTINDLRAKESREAAVAKVDEAIRKGRLIPAQRVWAISYCSADPAGFDKFMGSSPQIIQAGSDGTFVGRVGEPPKSQNGLTNRELEICANLGITSEKYAGARDNWNSQFPRPRLMMDDSNAFERGDPGTGDRAERTQ